MKIYVDESGNTGNDLVKDNQPFFVLASVMADDEQMSRILPVLRKEFEAHREIEEKEIKAGSWARAGRKAKALQTIEEKILECGGNISVVIVEKRYMAACMIVDYFFDYDYNDVKGLKWVNDKTSKIKAVNYFYEKQDDIFVRKFWTAFCNPDQTAFGGLIDGLLGINDNSEYEALLKGAKPHLTEIVDALIPHAPLGIPTGSLPRSTMFSPNFSSFCTLVNMLIPYCKIKGETAEIIFDSVPQFNDAYKSLFDIFTGIEVPSIPIYPNESPIYSWKGIITQFLTADSQTEPGLQLADIIASSVKCLMLKVHKGDLTNFREFDLFHVALLHALGTPPATVHYLVSKQYFRKYEDTIEKLIPLLNRIMTSR